MEKREDRARLGAFMRWQLLPFMVVVFVYAVLENWWIFSQVGSYSKPPYFCVFIYNIVLVASLAGLCFKKSKFFDLLNLALTFFFPFAVEIFNLAHVKESTEIDDHYEGLEEVDSFVGLFKLLQINQIAGLAFFFYAAHMRSKCLELARGNSHMRLHFEDFVFFKDLFESQHPTEGKISSSKIRWVMIMFIILAALKESLKAYNILISNERFKLFSILLFVAVNAFIVTMTFVFYRNRSVRYNILSMISTCLWLIETCLISSYWRLFILDSPNSLAANPVTLSYSIIFILVAGILFVWANYIRSLLLEDCGNLASAYKLLLYFKLTNTLDIQGENDMPPKYGSI